MSTPDRVRFEANERVDLGDQKALQLNGRTAIRRALKQLIFGDSNVYSDTVKCSQSKWQLHLSGSQITIDQGRGWAGEVLEDSSIDYGEAVGEDGDASQTLDWAGQPAGDYTIWVKVNYDPGEVGSRVFWNPATEEEQAQSLDTREVKGWSAIYALTSAGAPGDGYIQVGTTTWNGSAHSSTGSAGLTLFEGDLDTTGSETSPGWGDGVNDRSGTRSTYGIRGLISWFAMVRRQLGDIISNAGEFWATIPQTAVNDPGSDANLELLRDHYDTVTDPHGDSPTWTGTVTISGAGTLDVNGNADFAGQVLVRDELILDVDGGASLPQIDTSGDSSTGYLVLNEINPHAFHWDKNIGDLGEVAGTEGTALQHDGTSSTTIGGYLPLNTVINGAQKVSNGPYLSGTSAISVYGKSNGGGGMFFALFRKSTFGSVTTLGTWTVADGDFSGSGSIVALDSSNGTDWATLTEAQRTMGYPYQYILKVFLYGGALGTEFHGVSVATRHLYIHP